jgi:hypothetical protein
LAVSARTAFNNGSAAARPLHVSLCDVTYLWPSSKEND